MFGIQNYSNFILAIIVFQLIPGAGTVAILNATVRNGVGGGMKAVFGTLSGDFIYMLAAVPGRHPQCLPWHIGKCPMDRCCLSVLVWSEASTCISDGSFDRYGIGP